MCCCVLRPQAKSDVLSQLYCLQDDSEKWVDCFAQVLVTKHTGWHWGEEDTKVRTVYFPMQSLCVFVIRGSVSLEVEQTGEEAFQKKKREREKKRRQTTNQQN